MQAVEKPLPSVIVCLNQNKQNRFTCICCRVEFESAQLQRNHFKTEWHLYNLKRKVCSLEPIDMDGFKAIQASNLAEKDTAREQESEFDAHSYVDLGLSDSDLSSSDSVTIDDEEWETIEDGEFLDKHDAKINRLIARMIKPDTCLFCDNKSPNLRSNIDHMNVIHGFFIPEEQYLIDLDGLMDYLGLKVGAGATCLWCNKQFANLHGVRLHMQYKDHCKIFYDQERATNEFKDYYDYTEQQCIPMKPLDQLEIQTKRRSPRYVGRDDSSLAVASSSGGQGDSKALLSPAERSIINRHAKAIKTFCCRRAEDHLRVGLANNYTVRARLRHQNPI